MQPVCEYDDISRLDVMCISRLDSDTHNDIWDAEWCWESRLDSCENLEEKSRTDLDETYESRLGNYDGSRLVFYVRIWKNFRPVGWQTADLMLRSLSPQYPDTLTTRI